MIDSRFELRSLPSNSGYLVVERATQRLLAGVGQNANRAWVFPLNTPRGLPVVQEYAFDHPFHNGVFVGQANIRQNGREANFWAPSPDWRQPNNYVFQHLGELRYAEPPASEARDNGYRFTYRTTWRDEQLRPLLDEVRMIDVYDDGDATICDVVSTKTAAYGPLEFAATKYGAIGIRVQRQLLPLLGGQIVVDCDGELRRGLADEVANGKPCNYVAYEADVPQLGRFGVWMAILANSASADRCGPWFIRDYGMAMFNATMTAAIQVPEGESWSAALRVVAYDGPLSHKRALGWLPRS